MAKKNENNIETTGVDLNFFDVYNQPSRMNYDIIDGKNGKNTYVNWGVDNKLPDFIWQQYLKCSDLQALVNTTVDYIVGNDIVIEKPDYCLGSDMTVEDIVRRCIMDYILFGGFAVSCVRNNAGDRIVRVKYQNVMNVRVNEDLTMGYLSSNWSNWTTKNIIKIPLYNKDEAQPQFLLYFRGSLTRNINPIAIWQSGLKSVEVLNNTRLYNLRNIQNNFASNVIIALNGATIKSKELDEIKKKISAGYEGAENAGKTLLINNSNSEGKVEVTRLDSDKAANIYNDIQNSSIEDLYGAFRINKVLVGKNINTGFSRVEYQDIYAIYKATVIEPLRRQIKRVFKEINIGVAFDDLKIEWSEN